MVNAAPGAPAPKQEQEFDASAFLAELEASDARMQEHHEQITQPGLEEAMAALEEVRKTTFASLEGKSDEPMQAAQ